MAEPLIQKDLFADIHRGGRLQVRLANAHKMFCRQCPGLDRIGIALFDDATRLVKTFLASPLTGNPLTNYQLPLAEAESLAAAAIPGQARIVNDLQLFAQGKNEHTQKIRDLGMCSSYTLPIFEQDILRGFVFLTPDREVIFRRILSLKFPCLPTFWCRWCSTIRPR